MITEIEIVSEKILHLIDEKKRPISISEVESGWTGRRNLPIKALIGLFLKDMCI